ncbi:hypothetical protein ALC56_05089 [Trachymyrmex septentrionalis]|uniref:Uncharacterized protein n=1 Tax=Trachymyrmex septentrionalis TaxID=34720 RepID=A0A195FIE2_9HYME|nr:hypothetical protein ALC56_05089 [Trachymyrmex septentrionalis]
MGRDEVGREKRNEREREQEYRRHSQVCLGRLGSGVYEEEERCSRAGRSVGMARRGEELSAPLKSVGRRSPPRPRPLISPRCVANCSPPHGRSIVAILVAVVIVVVVVVVVVVIVVVAVVAVVVIVLIVFVGLVSKSKRSNSSSSSSSLLRILSNAN